MTGDDPYGAITVSKGLCELWHILGRRKKISSTTDVQIADLNATRFAESDFSNGSSGFLT